MSENLNRRKTPPEDHEWPWVWEALSFAMMVKSLIVGLASNMMNWKFILWFVVLASGLSFDHIINIARAALQVSGGDQ